MPLVQNDIVVMMREASEADDWPWMAALLKEGASEIERLRHDVERAISNHSADLNSNWRASPMTVLWTVICVLLFMGLFWTGGNPN